MTLPFREHLIPYLLVYYTPVLVGAFRRSQAKAKSAPIWVIFLVCMFTAWTVIGWLYALRLAFLDWEMPWDNFRSGGGTFMPRTGDTFVPSTDYSAARPPERHSCSSCGGSGGSYCSWCAGRGNWMENNTAMHCQSCGGSGRLTCSWCNGSGSVQG